MSDIIHAAYSKLQNFKGNGTWRATIRPGITCGNCRAELLVRCAGHAVLGEWDAAALAKDKRHALFESWLALPPGKRQAMDAEMQEMSAQSDEKGFPGHRGQAAWHLRTTSPDWKLSRRCWGKLANHHGAAVTFLDHRMYWRGACRFSHADGLPYWRKRLHMGHEAAAVDDASLQQLAGMIRDYFHRTEGRGNNCLVEPLRRGNLDYFFAYPEDFHNKARSGWMGSSKTSRTPRPLK